MSTETVTPAILTLACMARRLGVTQTWLRSEAKSGRVSCIPAGKRYLFSPEAVETALARRASQKSGRGSWHGRAVWRDGAEVLNVLLDKMERWRKSLFLNTFLKYRGTESRLILTRRSDDRNMPLLHPPCVEGNLSPSFGAAIAFYGTLWSYFLWVVFRYDLSFSNENAVTSEYARSCPSLDRFSKITR